MYSNMFKPENRDSRHVTADRPEPMNENRNGDTGIALPLF
jgi:hypothetical protein